MYLNKNWKLKPVTHSGELNTQESPSLSVWSVEMAERSEYMRNMKVSLEESSLRENTGMSWAQKIKELLWQYIQCC